jgi:PAS domain S-box-containing protein
LKRRSKDERSQGPGADPVRWAMCCAAEAVANKASDDSFGILVRGAARALDVDLSFIGVIADDKTDAVRAIAVCDRGVMQDNFEYELKGTPCEHVVGQRFRFHAEGIQALFPDPHVKEIGGVGYAAIPLFDSRGGAMGLMAIVDRKPLLDRELTECILRIFSVRAAVELERRRAEWALRQSEESYRSIFEAAEDALFVYNANTGAILDVNPKACEVYGYTRDELMQLDIGALSSGVEPSTQERAADLLEQARQDGPVRMEWRRRNKDGSLHWDEVYIKRVKIGGSDRILAVTREITERKLREQQLRKSEDRLRMTVDTALDCIIGMNTQGDIIEFNPAAEETFGHRKFDVLGTNLAELIIPPQFRAAHANGMQHYLATGKGAYLGQRVEVMAMRADSSEFPAELSVDVAQGPDGAIFIAYLRDITERQRSEDERVRLESQLRQAQKMEAIGQLTGGVAHDFNNILTSTMGYLTMAQEQAGQYTDDKLDRYLDRAEQSGQRAKRLIQQMLTFSRGQRGEPRSLQLAPNITDAVRLMRSSLPSSVEIDTAFDDGVPCVLIDPLHVEQVLMNLCINARDAMQGKGRLTITLQARHCGGCTCTSCHQAVDGDFVELAVSDDGPGIAPDVIERMFEPFFSTKEAGSGSGMGLAMVHGIVHEYGGHIQVESKPGGGARLRVWFPAWFPPTGEEVGEGQIDGTAVEAASSKPRLQGRVLLTDDEPSVREFMSELLGSWGLDVSLAEDGIASCEAFAADPDGFDLVLLDQTMPRMTGLEAAAQMAKLRPAVPVLLYTGYSDQVSPARLAAAGIRSLIRKPLDIQAFRQLLEELLQAGGDDERSR